MAWDKNLPSGSQDIALGDNAIRDNNAAIETAMDLEHRFTTGSNQSGRHTFVLDTTANLAALADLADGSIGFSTNIRTGKASLMVYRSGAFEAADCGQTDICRLDENGVFTAAQWTSWDAVSVSGGALAIDASGDPWKYTIATGNFTVSNPTGISSNATQILLGIQMDGTGGHTISFGSGYRATGGVVAIDTSANAKNLLTLTLMWDGNWLVTSVPNWSTLIT